MSRQTNTQNPFEVYAIPYDGPADVPAKTVVGSKAHNLMRMARRGLVVPPGFVLGTGVCRAFLKDGPQALAGLAEVLAHELRGLETKTGRILGDAKRPLFVSVRSGAPISMPGMMQTVLNVGLNRTTLRGLLRITGNPRLAADCRRRLVQQYAEVVHDIDTKPFDDLEAEKLKEENVNRIEELDSRGLNELAEAFEEKFEALTEDALHSDPMQQLQETVEAILKSWMSARAQSYRKLNRIPDDMGTAVLVQAMVFGNAGPLSGSGVGFTRNPSDGSNKLYIDYLSNAQGEDVVAGHRNALGAAELERRLPDVYRQLVEGRTILEGEFGDMQDFEFTVEDGHLYMLQARAGKRTPLAALRIAHDLVAEQVIPPETAARLLDGIDLDAIQVVEMTAGDAKPIAGGVPASGGIAVGCAVFDPGRVAQYRREGKPIVLVRENAETGDIESLSQAVALVTRSGARTSHAAVVARELGKVCVVGCSDLSIDGGQRSGTFGSVVVKEGDLLTVDGTAGSIFQGNLEVRRRRPDELLAEVRGWHPQKALAKTAK